MKLSFQVPAIPPLTGGLNDRFGQLHDYVVRLLLPYLFTWADAALAANLDSLHFNVGGLGTQDGANKTFRCPLGKIRLDPSGHPQALLVQNGAVLQHVTGVPAPGQWTASATNIITGAAPAAIDSFFLGMVVLV